MDKSTPLGCLFLVLLVILFNIIKSGLGDSAAYGGAALFTAFLLIVLVVGMIRRKVEVNKEKRAKQQELENRGLTASTFGKHVHGLPMPEGKICEIYSFPEKVEIKSDHMQFNLDKTKITDVTITTDTEIQKQYVSSVGRAVGGAVLFGPLGAMIGGRAKEKTLKTLTNYLIFTYQKENENEPIFIGFEITTSNLIQGGKFVDEFKETNQDRETVIDL